MKSPSTYQQQLDFTGVSLHKENNRESQQHLEDDSEHFDNQVQLVLSLLQKGVKLTCDMARDDYKIRHLPRRICTLRREMNIPVKDRWKGNIKEYFL